MKKSKLTLLAATALGASLVHASPAAFAAPMEAAIVEDASRVAATAPAAHEDRAIAAKRAGLLAAFFAAGGALIALLGPRKVASAVSGGARVAASATVAAAKTAGSAVGKAVKSPLRSLMLFSGLAVFALTGVSLYDLEWIVGLALGAALTLMAVFGGGKLRKAFAPVRA